MTGRTDSQPAVRVTFVHEQHLGHRTYADNLKAMVVERADVDTTWVPVTYDTTASWVDRLPFPRSVIGALAGRREVRRGLAAKPADVHMFNTQVPAVLGGDLTRSRPYIVITDVTPVQYDRIADGYGHQADSWGPLRWMKHRMNRRVFEDAAWCVGWSSWAAASFVDDYGVDPARVTVIPPGVDTETWRPPVDRLHEGTRILFVGGDFSRKGGDLLLKSLASLPDDVELTLVTRSPVARGPRIRVFDDLVPNDPRLIELFRSSDMFAIPSRAETFGIAAVEASAMGLPVVASDVGGFRDIVSDGETGLVVGAGDQAALTRALHRLVDDADLRSRFGTAARARVVERFDARKNAARLFSLVRAMPASAPSGTTSPDTGR